MNEYTIPNREAELVLHRLVTERIPILAMFESADSSVKAKMTGFLVSSTPSHGLRICHAWPKEDSAGDHPDLPTYLILTGAIGSYCEYQDETEGPEGFKFKFSLRIYMPNGDTLTLIEVHEAKH